MMIHTADIDDIFVFQRHYQLDRIMPMNGIGLVVGIVIQHDVFFLVIFNGFVFPRKILYHSIPPNRKLLSEVIIQLIL